MAPILRTFAYWPVLAILVLALPALAVVAQFARPLALDIGGQDDSFYLRGFYAPEQGSGTDFRWTGDEAQIRVPAAPGDSDWTLTLRLSGERPPAVPPPRVDVLVDGRLVARLDTIAAFRDYTLRVRREMLPPEDFTITLRTATFDPPGDADNRQLGAVLDEVTLTPRRVGAARPFIPPLAFGVTLVAFLAAVAATAGWLRVDRRVTALLLLLALGAFLAGLVFEHDIAAAYLPDLLLAAVVVFGAALALRPLVRRLYRTGGVDMSAHEERLLLAFFVCGAAVHLAGVFFPGFWAHDIGFQVHRLEDALNGRLLVATQSSEWGYRTAPYPPVLYLLLTPVALIAGDHALPLRLVPPLLDASAVFLIFYLLRRCGLASPAPLLGAFFATLLPATFQLLWWGFYANLFGQWATLAAVTIAVAHWQELGRWKVFGALVACIGLALLSHPGTFVLTIALIPLLALPLAFTADRADRRRAGLLVLALIAAGAAVYSLYYWHFTALLFDELRHWQPPGSAPGPEDDRGWEPAYIGNRVFALPFALYFAAAWLAGVAMLRAGRRALGWLVLAILATASIFATVHVVVGVWVRYFVFLTPALAIGAGVVVAALYRRGRWGRLATYGILTYCTAASLFFWLMITVGDQRSPYP